jgi:hypothetical protein
VTSFSDFAVGEPVPTHEIVATAGPGGSIAPSGTVSVEQGADQTFTITADACYAIEEVFVDDVSVGAVASYTFEDVDADHAIHATFAVIQYTITASAGPGGSIDPAGAVSVECGLDQTFTITPDPCYAIAEVLVDGSSVGAVGTFTFTDVQADHTISASFALTDYTITAGAGPGGSITPSGAVTIDCGADQSFTITPDPCYAIADVLVDGSSVGVVNGYTFTNVQADHTISATFALLTYTITGCWVRW